MKLPRLLSVVAVVLLCLFIRDLGPSPNDACLGSASESWVNPTSVLLVALSGQRFSIASESFRARFCPRGGAGPCYDYPKLYVYYSNCGVTTLPLSEIDYFESTGEFSPTYCIQATQSARLVTEALDRAVYIQGQHWSMVGTDLSHGETIVLPFSELGFFGKQ